MTTRSWRDKAGLTAIILFTVDIVALVVKCAIYGKLFRDHFMVLEVMTLSALLASIIVIPLALVGLRKWLRVAMTFGALVVTYLWTSEIAWWALVR